VFERGIKEEFWLLLKEELETSVKYHEGLAIEHAKKEENKEATREAIYADVLREILASPYKIVSYHNNVFLKFGNFVKDKLKK